MFDKYWYPEADRLTLPFCFFHIMSYKERQQVETSKKRVILYTPPNEEDEGEDVSDPIRPGAMQTIVDNIVTQPQEYQMDLIVPFLPMDRTIQENHAAMDNLIGGFGDLVGDMPEEALTWAMNKVSIVQDLLDKASASMRAQQRYLGGNDNNTIDWENRDAVSGSDAMVNKNSLDAMIGKIVTLKTWLGDDYKYVVITDKTSEKRSIEDRVLRVSLTCQEMPILSVSPVEGETEPISRPWVLNVVDSLGNLSGMARTVPALETGGEGS
jgi:hypothetical protein